MCKNNNFFTVLLVALLSFVLSACQGDTSSSLSAGDATQGNSDTNAEFVLHKASGHYISASDEGMLTVWSNDKQTQLNQITVSSTALNSLVISPDSEKLIVGDEGGTVHFFYMDNGGILTGSHKMYSVMGSGRVSELNFDQLSYNFSSVTEDGQLRLWDQNVNSPVKESLYIDKSIEQTVSENLIPPPSAPR